MLRGLKPAPKLSTLGHGPSLWPGPVWLWPPSPLLSSLDFWKAPRAVPTLDCSQVPYSTLAFHVYSREFRVVFNLLKIIISIHSFSLPLEQKVALLPMPPLPAAPVVPWPTFLASPLQPIALNPTQQPQLVLFLGATCIS